MGWRLIAMLAGVRFSARFVADVWSKFSCGTLSLSQRTWLPPSYFVIARDDLWAEVQALHTVSYFFGSFARKFIAK
jgi:hypothetical protein